MKYSPEEEMKFLTEIVYSLCLRSNYEHLHRSQKYAANYTHLQKKYEIKIEFKKIRKY